MPALKPGDFAPDFALTALNQGVRKLFRLSEHRANNVLLLFHPLNWTPASELLVRAVAGQSTAIAAAGAELIAISVDSVFNTMAWEKAIGPLDLYLGSDYWPHGAVAEQYGVLRTSGDSAGASAPAAFVVDRQGRITFAREYAEGQSPDVEELVEALRLANSSAA
jgi:peroxiredoxin (alkyl hydroperoxide reductase subunit C)